VIIARLFAKVSIKCYGGEEESHETFFLVYAGGPFCWAGADKPNLVVIEIEHGSKVVGRRSLVLNDGRLTRYGRWGGALVA
jgi:hypothetical protein